MWERTGSARSWSLAGGTLQGSGCATSLAVQEPTMNLRALPVPVGSPLQALVPSTAHFPTRTGRHALGLSISPGTAEAGVLPMFLPVCSSCF